MGDVGLRAEHGSNPSSLRVKSCAAPTRASACVLRGHGCCGLAHGPLTLGPDTGGLQGILVLHMEQVSNMLNMRVFVDTDDDVRLARRCLLSIFLLLCWKGGPPTSWDLLRLAILDTEMPGRKDRH